MAKPAGSVSNHDQQRMEAFRSVPPLLHMQVAKPFQVAHGERLHVGQGGQPHEQAHQSPAASSVRGDASAPWWSRLGTNCSRAKYTRRSSIRFVMNGPRLLLIWPDSSAHRIGFHSVPPHEILLFTSVRAPPKFSFGSGLTALPGENNSRKPSILRSFYELRNVFAPQTRRRFHSRSARIH